MKYNLNEMSDLVKIYDDLSMVNVADGDFIDWISIFDFNTYTISNMYEEISGLTSQDDDYIENYNEVIQYLVDRDYNLSDLIEGKAERDESDEEIIETIEYYL